MPNLKGSITFFIFLTVAWFAFDHFLSGVNPGRRGNTTPINIQGNTFHAEIVSSKEDLEKGLGGRSELCASCGMLFKFKESGKHSFWMKGMLIPLDILWISKGKVAHIEKDIQSDFKGTLASSEDAEFVLEINAGKSDELGIKVGDLVSF